MSSFLRIKQNHLLQEASKNDYMLSGIRNSVNSRNGTCKPTLQTEHKASEISSLDMRINSMAQFSVYNIAGFLIIKSRHEQQSRSRTIRHGYTLRRRLRAA